MNYLNLGRVAPIAFAIAALPAAVSADEIGCSASASLAYVGCTFSSRDDYFTERAKCLDQAGGDVGACFDAARVVLEGDDEECADVLEARATLCEALDDAPHEPAFGAAFAANFVDPLQIGVSVEANPYVPLTQGNRWVYEGTFEEDGEMVTETIVIDVLPETKLIDGITCVVVRDVVYVDDELVEDTDDWFAQDVDGNVWYCGEEVKDYEYTDGDQPSVPELVSDDGSFKAGRDGDKAGIQIPATPELGALFRQEVSISNAEDVIEVISVSASETSPAATCDGNCLVTRDFSPLDPGVEENKYYLPGVGRIVEINLESGARVELIEYTVN